MEVIVFRHFIEISLVETTILTSFIFSCSSPPAKESAQATLLSQADFQARQEKCSFCLDEPHKRVVMLIDDKARKHFHVLIGRNYFEELEPVDFLVLVKEAATCLGIDYNEVQPQLFIPDEPEQPELPKILLQLLKE